MNGISSRRNAFRELWKEYNALEKVTPHTGIGILREIAKLYYGTHPLSEEWVKIYQAMLWDNETDFHDLNRILEIEVQMLTNINPTRHAKLLIFKKHALQQTQEKNSGFNTFLILQR